MKKGVAAKFKKMLKKGTYASKYISPKGEKESEGSPSPKAEELKNKLFGMLVK